MFLHRNSRWPQKWWENNFCEKLPVDFALTLGVKNFVEIALSHTISEKNVFFAFNAEIQDDCHKWGKPFFCEKMPVHSPHTLVVKNCIKIALSRTISEINAFLCFMQKFKMTVKNGRKTIFAKYC